MPDNTKPAEGEAVNFIAIVIAALTAAKALLEYHNGSIEWACFDLGVAVYFSLFSLQQSK